MLSALIAIVATFFVTLAVYRLGVWGIAGCIAMNLLVRRWLKKRADKLEVRVTEEAYERAHPEEFAEESEGD